MVTDLVIEKPEFLPHSGESVDYGNWMPKKFIATGFFSCGICTILAVIIPIFAARITLGGFAVFCGGFACYAFAVYHQFSPEGGNLQARVHELLVELLPWDGRGCCLEIGCGSAPVSIQLAKRYPRGNIVATDYWGETFFEYSEAQCRKNALLEGVADRIEFRFANAADLPFDDASFDAVVSNLTFHEVSEFKRGEKYKSFVEALRVLKPGGAFAVQDLFRQKITFGEFKQLREILSGIVSELHWIDSFTELEIPRWLDNVVILKGLGIFYGRK